MDFAKYWVGGSAAGYQIDRSLRFNDDDSVYLSKAFASAGNRKTWTWSGWVKRSTLSTTQNLFSANGGGTAFSGIRFAADNTLAIFDYNSSSFLYYLLTTQVFRDASSWYHIVVAFDSTQATSSDRLKLYINGGLIADFSTATYPSLNLDSYINNTNGHTLGCSNSSGYAEGFDGYLADVHFIDGQALAASDFGEFSAATGVWNPIQFSGSYGTNGFHLDFSDNTSTTTITEDSSGNNHDWTANNISVTAGADNDSLIDTPTNYTASPNNGGNYATLNPLDFSSAGSPTLKNGNLDAEAGSGWQTVAATLGNLTSGRWYWEVTLGGGSGHRTGLSSVSRSNASSSQLLGSGDIAVNSSDGYVYVDGSTVGSAAGNLSGKTVGIALNLDANSVSFYQNGSLIHTVSSLSSTASWTPVHATRYSAVDNLNFGQRPFAYTPPTDHVSLCTQNLPDPTIADPSTAVDAIAYTGNGGSKTISGVGFSSDLIWTKCRNQARSNYLMDTVRGISKYLISEQTSTEGTNTTNRILSVTSDGWTLGTNNGFNGNSDTYVAWAWDGGANSSKTYTVKVVSDSGNKYRFDDFGTSAVTLDLEEGSTYVFDQSDSSNSGHPLRFSTTSDGTHNSGSEYTTGVTTTGTPGSSGAKTTIVVAASAPTLYYYCSAHSGMGGQANTNSTAGASNFAGSIQSTVRANAEAGFSIVEFTGNATSGATVGHGLGIAPRFIITKKQDVTDDWFTYHESAGNTKFLKLNSSNADSSNTTAWNDTSPTSTVFSLGSSNATNQNGQDFIAYCFAPVEGYSSFGSYTGNGSSSDGTFVYLGFRPAVVITKRIDSTGSWYIFDSARANYNETEPYTHANTSNVEATDLGWDLLSNGFKHRTNYVEQNTSNGQYLFMAWAEHPFKTARAR